MYCSFCGVAVGQGLSYCNRCGGQLNGAKKDGGIGQQSQSFLESLVWAMVAVFIVGLGCIIGLMAMMKQLLNFDQQTIIAFASVSFLFALGVEAVLLWMLLRHRNDAQKASDAALQHKEQATKELGAEPAPRALAEPVPGITEHTTRAFEPIYSEPKSN